MPVIIDDRKTEAGVLGGREDAAAVRLTGLTSRRLVGRSCSVLI